MSDTSMFDPFRSPWITLFSCKYASADANCVACQSLMRDVPLSRAGKGAYEGHSIGLGVFYQISGDIAVVDERRQEGDMLVFDQDTQEGQKIWMREPLPDPDFSEERLVQGKPSAAKALLTGRRFTHRRTFCSGSSHIRPETLDCNLPVFWMHPTDDIARRSAGDNRSSGVHHNIAWTEQRGLSLERRFDRQVSQVPQLPRH